MVLDYYRLCQEQGIKKVELEVELIFVSILYADVHLSIFAIVDSYLVLDEKKVIAAYLFSH